jgi:hypothetical protein
VSYRVVPHASARTQLADFPSDALDALLSRLADVADQPWDAMPVHGSPSEFRQAQFGEHGLVSFHVNDTTEVITVYDVTWAG